MANSDFDPLTQAKALANALREAHEAQPSFKAWKAAEALVEQLQGDEVIVAPRKNVWISHAGEVRREVTIRHRARPTQADAANSVLLKFNKPLTTPELLEEIQKVGARVGGSDPLMVLSSALSKDDRFVSVRWCNERTWWFKDKPVPGGADDDDDEEEVHVQARPLSSDDDIEDLLGDTSGVDSF